MKKQTKTLSKQRYVPKMILWSGRMQFCQLDWKSFEKIDQFLLNGRNWWEKNMFDRKKFYHKMLQWTDRKQFWGHKRELFVEMPEMKSIKLQWWAKKELFQKRNIFNRSPWQVVSSFDKTAICFPTKKPLISRSMFEKDKKHTKTFQSRCLTSNWSFGLVESSVINLAEKNFNKDQ